MILIIKSFFLTKKNKIRKKKQKVGCCYVCNAVFNIFHGGKTDVKSQLKSGRHKKPLNIDYFKGATRSKFDLRITACEGV